MTVSSIPFTLPGLALIAILLFFGVQAARILMVKPPRETPA